VSEPLSALGALVLLQQQYDIPDHDVFEGEDGWIAIGRSGTTIYYVSRHSGHVRVSTAGRWENLEVRDA
jgi:spore maturation protein SpmB